LLSTRETVASDTPARFATSRMVWAILVVLCANPGPIACGWLEWENLSRPCEKGHAA
jgi:hypothetical protein